MKKVVILTGASSGIGYDSAIKLAKQGHKVYAAARRVDLMQPLTSFGVVPLSLDVTNDESMKKAVQAVLDAESRIDVLVDEARRQLEVNVFGLARMCQLVLPVMRQQGSGLIVNTSSIAGKIVLPYGGWYHVSKFSVEALSDALRMELKPFGINVSMIEPGGIKTDWGIIAARHLRESSEGTPYENSALRESQLLHAAYSGRYLSSPSVITRAISRAVNSRHPKARYRTGRFAHLGVFFHWMLPARWWDAMMRGFCKIKIRKRTT